METPVKYLEIPKELEIRDRYDFTKDILSLDIINDHFLIGNESNVERKWKMDEHYGHLRDFKSFLKTVWDEYSFEEGLDNKTAYVDYVRQYRPYKDGKSWEFREWWEDDKGNKVSFYSEQYMEWRVDISYGLIYNVEVEKDTIFTRHLKNGEVFYDYRLPYEKNEELYEHMWEDNYVRFLIKRQEYAFRDEEVDNYYER